MKHNMLKEFTKKEKKKTSFIF